MTRALRGAALLLVAVGVAWCLGQPADAHSGLRFSSPLSGATLGDSPALVQLTFVERPEASLATIRVEDTSGSSYHADRPEPVSGDPLSLAVRLRPLGRGVYTVRWRVVSAVDGHASAGAFVFGVLVDPSGAAVTTAEETSVSAVEVLARTILLGGLMLALGAATASLLRFGSERDAAVAAVGWLAAMAGLALLAGAQSRVAGVELMELSGTAIGRALGWRLIALAVAGGGILVAVFARRAGRVQVARAGFAGAAIGTLAAMVAHAAAGHAGAGRWPVMPTVVFQVVHFGAVGIWIGGLAAVLAGLKGPASGARAASIRRFSTVAAAVLGLVTVSGVARSLQEVTAWGDLMATAYGIVVMSKLALLAIIVALAAVNRWRSVPAAATTSLGPLRKVGSIELAVALVAVLAAALLGALPPPAATQAIAGIEASGADFGTTVRARLTAASDQPGPNRFSVQLRDYDSAAPMTADRVSLRFTPLDDPGVTPTQLSLAAAPEGVYAGSGANLSFAGRWHIQVLIERAGSSVEVPLNIEARQPVQFVSVLRPPGSPAAYTVEVAGIGFVKVVTADRPGPTALEVSCLNVIYEPLTIAEIVVTSGMALDQQLPVTRVNRNQFTTMVELGPGENRFSVVARTDAGTRLRAVLTIEPSQR